MSDSWKDSLKKGADGFVFFMLFCCSVGCSTYVWFFDNTTVDIQILIGTIAIFFSFLFAQASHVALTDITRNKDISGVIKTIYFLLGGMNLFFFLIHLNNTGYPQGYMIKIIFLIIMGAGNQVFTKYRFIPKKPKRELTLTSVNHDEAA